MSCKALRVMNKGEKARFVDLEFEPPAAGEVRVRVDWSCLNYKDALAVTASSPIMRRLPCTAGIDLAGTVEQSADPRFAAGDRVLACGANLGEKLDGGLAEAAQLPADILVRLPADFSAREAMSYGTAGFTAALALAKMLHNGQAPEQGPIAISGATGGVGSIATALFARAGFRVAALSRKPDQDAYLKALGASEIVAAAEAEVESPLMRPRWGGAVDNLGGDMLAYLLATTAPHGNVASIGLAASFKLKTTVMPLILRGVNLLGIHSVEIPDALRQDTWQQLFGDWRLPEPERFIHREISLDEVPEACEALIQGAVAGRFLVRIGGA